MAWQGRSPGKAIGAGNHRAINLPAGVLRIHRSPIAVISRTGLFRTFSARTAALLLSIRLTYGIYVNFATAAETRRHRGAANVCSPSQSDLCAPSYAFRPCNAILFTPLRASAGTEDERLTGYLLYVLLALAAAAGAAAGYFVASTIGRGRIAAVERRAGEKIHAAGVEREKAIKRYREAREDTKAMKAQVASALGQRATAVDKLTVMARNVKTLRAERAATKEKVKALQTSLTTVHQRTVSLQREFEKAGQFYKRELQKSFRKRQQLDVELKRAREEQQAFEKRIKESVLEHGSPEEMVTAAQLRFGQIEMLERAVDRLEAENKDLKEEIRQRKEDYEALRQDLKEVDELRIHNQHLVRALEALEESRQQHEEEAVEARSKADESEQLSETLRMRLSNLEESFAAIAQDQQQAIQGMREVAAANESGTNPRLSGTRS